jgi:hypothetical protein
MARRALTPAYSCQCPNAARLQVAKTQCDPGFGGRYGVVGEREGVSGLGGPGGLANQLAGALREGGVLSVAAHTRGYIGQRRPRRVNGPSRQSRVSPAEAGP